MNERFNPAPDLDLGHQVQAHLSTDREWLDIQLNGQVGSASELIVLRVEQACKLRDWLIVVCPSVTRISSYGSPNLTELYNTIIGLEKLSACAPALLEMIKENKR